MKPPVKSEFGALQEEIIARLKMRADALGALPRTPEFTAFGSGSDSL
jgi:hypothetical protein